MNYVVTVDNILNICFYSITDLMQADRINRITTTASPHLRRRLCEYSYVETSLKITNLQAGYFQIAKVKGLVILSLSLIKMSMQWALD